MEESAKQRANRELIEFLNELRVALPGVQVLFAFLLTVPFTQRFATVTEFQKDVYFVTLACALIATCLLIAPSAHHRLRFRHDDKEYILRMSNRLAVAGLGFLALAMTSVMLLITDFLFGATMAAIVTTLSGLMFALLWYAMPISRTVTVDRER